MFILGYWPLEPQPMKVYPPQIKPFSVAVYGNDMVLALAQSGELILLLLLCESDYLIRII